MMRIVILIIPIFLMTISLKGQYSMNTTLKTYEDLAEPISVNNGNIWDETSYYPIYFNFNFDITGQTYTSLNVLAGGGISFPGFGTKELAVFHTPFGGYLLKDKGLASSLSEISYEISGTVGQNILRIQWKNAGFVQWYSASDTADFIDFQIWLYEIDNHIEIHFGNSSTDPGTYGFPEYSDPNPGSSIIFSFDQCSNVFGITGPCNLPSYWIYNDCSWTPSFIDGTPSNDITYNIYPTLTDLQNLNNNPFSIFPNPTNGIINITELPNNFIIQKISLTNQFGQNCYFNGNFHQEINDNILDLNNVENGIYILKLTSTENQTIYNKLIINSD